MKRLFLLSVFTVSVFITQAQIMHPVQWSYAAKRLSKTEAVVFLKADIETPWHIYSTAQPDGGPIKTSFLFATSKDYELVGDMTEPKPKRKYDDSFKIDVLYFEQSVTYQQKIKLLAKQSSVKGSLKFMCCNDKQCLPPETVSFSIPIK